MGFNNSRVSSNSGFQSVSPALNSGFQFRLTQHLLQGFGFPANTRFIRIAKNNRELSDVAFRLQILTTVDQIENMYWDLVYPKNQREKQESLAFSQQTLSDTMEEVEIVSAGAHRSGAGAEHGCGRPAGSERSPDQSSIAAVGHEERAQPYSARSCWPRRT